MAKIDRKYTNDDITVVWKSELCIHCAKCAVGLPKVFNPKSRPWVNMEGATSERILTQANKCPSGALSAYKNEDGPKEEETEQNSTVNIEVKNGGPLLVSGTVLVKDKDGTETLKENKTAFCRCGLSTNKPYCDGKHRGTDFDK